jgi:hypothetical protein
MGLMKNPFKKKTKNKKQEPQIENPREVVNALEALFASRLIDKKRLYFYNFLRGIALGAGSVIGATLVITMLLWILSLFDTTPLLGPIVDNINEAISENR